MRQEPLRWAVVDHNQNLLCWFTSCKKAIDYIKEQHQEGIITNGWRIKTAYEVQKMGVE